MEGVEIAHKLKTHTKRLHRTLTQTFLFMKKRPIRGFITITCCGQKQTTEDDAAAVGRETLHLSLTCLTPLMANHWLHYCQIINIKTANVCISSVCTHRHIPAEGLHVVCLLSL